MDKYSISIEMHYSLFNNSEHKMDAIVHNECERYLLKSLSEISKYIDTNIAIEVKPKEEGSLVDVYNYIIGSIDFGDIAGLLIGALMSHFISPAKHKNEASKDIIEAAKALKEGNFTEEEAGILVNGNPKLQEFVSKFYSNVSQETTIKEIESITRFPNSNKCIRNRVERKSFEERIEESKKEVQTILNTTIIIASPVLVDNKALLWKGVYSGKTISFKIEDYAFLNQVYNRKVRFEFGTSINCDLKIEKRAREYDSDDKAKYAYTVVLVRNWYDGETYYDGEKELIKE